MRGMPWCSWKDVGIRWSFYDARNIGKQGSSGRTRHEAKRRDCNDNYGGGKRSRSKGGSEICQGEIWEEPNLKKVEKDQDAAAGRADREQVELS